MTEQEKQLLLQDLCARLPYGVVAYDEYTRDRGMVTLVGKEHLEIEVWPVYNLVQLNMAKPYLRPISSMTEEEQKEFVGFHCVNICPMILTDMLTLDNENKMFDWLNAHHFDYRGLIEKGLAIEAPEGMYAALNKETHTPMTVEEAKAFIRQHNVVHPRCKQCKESFCDGCAETVDRELVNDVISGKINESTVSNR